MQGRWSEARGSFDHVLTLAKSVERPDLVRSAALEAAMMSAELGDFVDARRRLELAIQALRDERADHYAWQLTLVLATLPSVHRDEAQVLLQGLAREAPASARGLVCLDVELVAALLRIDPPEVLRCGTGHSEAYVYRGGLALAAGLRAQLAGDSATARSALARAESEGVRDTLLAPYANLLLARINGTPQDAPVPDPPYAVPHRWGLRWREVPKGP